MKLEHTGNWGRNKRSCKLFVKLFITIMEYSQYISIYQLFHFSLLCSTAVEVRVTKEKFIIAISLENNQLAAKVVKLQIWRINQVCLMQKSQKLLNFFSEINNKNLQQFAHFHAPLYSLISQGFLSTTLKKLKLWITS